MKKKMKSFFELKREAELRKQPEKKVQQKMVKKKVKRKAKEFNPDSLGEGLYGIVSESFGRQYKKKNRFL